jgi:hypothetical protein
MLTALLVLFRSIGLICGGHRAVALENLALRQQLAVDAFGQAPGAPHKGTIIGSGNIRLGRALR